MLEDRLAWTDVVSGDFELSSEDMYKIGGRGGKKESCVQGKFN